MKKIYIADIRGNVVNGRISGHIIPVAKNYMSVLGDDYDVKIAAGPAILNSFDPKDCIVLPYNVNGESCSDRLKLFCNFIVLLIKSHGQPIIIQQASIVTTFIAIALFHWWTNKIYLIKYITANKDSIFKKYLYSLSKYKISGFICPNDNVGRELGRPYCVVTDYIKTEMPSIKAFSERKWDICMIGSITKDKGVLEAAEFLAGTKYKVVIAGRIAEKQLESRLFELRDNNPNLECHYEFVSDEDYKYYITNSKFCMLNYRGTYMDRSSGAILDNIFLGTPVIGNKCNAMNIICYDHVGFVYDKLHDLNLEKVISEENYADYINHIAVFYDKQKIYKENLKAFLER